MDPETSRSGRADVERQADMDSYPQTREAIPPGKLENIIITLQKCRDGMGYVYVLQEGIYF